MRHRTESDELPADVLAFVAEQIDTVPHLEALLLLYGQAAERWTDERIAARLYVSLDTARLILRDLEQRRLARAATDGPVTTYAYDSAWDKSGELMARVAQSYAEHLARLATFIHAKAPRSVMEFARAFEFKKDR